MGGVPLLVFGYILSNHIVVSPCRKDRCGSVVQDMLYAHAWATYHSHTYGGCCHRARNCAPLIATLGLSTILREDANCSTYQPLSDKVYRKELKFLTHTWLRYMRSQRAVTANKTTHTIVAHVRRGDVSAIQKQRYRPNSYYIGKIEQRRLPSSRVVIFTENSEPLDEFYKQNYTVDLTHNLSHIWDTIISADVFIMSASGFSYVPAIFAHGIVVYTPFWHQPLPWWEY